MEQALPKAHGFDRILDGKAVSLYSICGPANKCCCQITNYGARMVSLTVPDKNGINTDVILGYSGLDTYREPPENFMGAVLGRCANRIAAGLFVLDGVTYVLPTNENHNTLNGGPGGLHARVWDVLKHETGMLVLTYHSKDEEEGFPGNLDIELIYEWHEPGSLKISFHAMTDKPTLVNLSNFICFNLNGEDSGGVTDHELYINSEAVTETGERRIPTGQFRSVEGTPYDFRQLRDIAISGERQKSPINESPDQNFVLNRSNPALRLRSHRTGIELQIHTNRPGLQFDSCGDVWGSRNGKYGRAYTPGSGVMLAPGGFPDAIHHPQFPSVVLRPGEVYFSSSEYRFSRG